MKYITPKPYLWSKTYKRDYSKFHMRKTREKKLYTWVSKTQRNYLFLEISYLPRKLNK